MKTAQNIRQEVIWLSTTTVVINRLIDKQWMTWQGSIKTPEDRRIFQLVR